MWPRREQALPVLRFGFMEDREQNKKKVRKIVTERLRRFYAELREKCADAEEYLQGVLQRHKPPRDPPTR